MSLTSFLKIILLSGLAFRVWIQVWPGKNIGPSLKPWTMTSIRKNSLLWKLVTRIAPGYPKSCGTVKLAAYSTMLEWFDGFGNQPLTKDSILLPDLVTASTKQVILKEIEMGLKRKSQTNIMLQTLMQLKNSLLEINMNQDFLYRKSASIIWNWIKIVVHISSLLSSVPYLCHNSKRGYKMVVNKHKFPSCIKTKVTTFKETSKKGPSSKNCNPSN